MHNICVIQGLGTNVPFRILRMLLSSVFYNLSNDGAKLLVFATRSYDPRSRKLYPQSYLKRFALNNRNTCIASYTCLTSNRTISMKEAIKE